MSYCLLISVETSPLSDVVVIVGGNLHLMANQVAERGAGTRGVTAYPKYIVKKNKKSAPRIVLKKVCFRTLLTQRTRRLHKNMSMQYQRIRLPSK